MASFQARRKHGDPFPLDCKALEDTASASGIFEPRRALWIGDSLNKLAMPGQNSFSTVLSSERRPTGVQEAVRHRILDSLSQYGQRPEGMEPETALQSLQSAAISYDGMPNNLAGYDPDKLNVLRSQVTPKRITSFLPPEPAKLVHHYESQIVLPLSGEAKPFTPYWDPALKYDSGKRLDFILRLHRCGLVKLRRAPKSFIGAFFVKKKTPDAIRMVLDCRGTNQLHQPPPTTRLGSARCYADLDLSELRDGEGWGIEADVNDAFYNFAIPELTHYFAFNHPMEARRWSDLGVSAREVYDPELRCNVSVGDREVLYPCVEAVPMGWSWALFLCNEAVLQICKSRSPWPDGVFRERKPAPQLYAWRTAIGVYVDNITILGKSQRDVAERADWVRTAFERAGIPLTWSQSEPVRSLESVGCVLDFERRELSNKPKRVWKFFLASIALLRRQKVKGKTLQVWAGHFTSICAFIPCALSCLQHTYRFIRAADHGGRVKLWSSVRREVKIASAVAWLSRRDLGAPFCLTAEIGDSSTSGYALMAGRPGVERLRKAMAVHEKWRFIPMPDALKSVAALGDAERFEVKLLEVLGLSEGVQASAVDGTARSVQPAGLSTRYASMVVDALKEGSWLGTSAIRSQVRATPGKRVDVDVPALIEPLDEFFADVGNFRVLWSRRWRNVDEHINVKECRVAVSSLKRTCRVKELLGHRKLTVSDNMVTVSALSKGRSASFQMNRQCMIAAAYQLGCGVVWHLRHVETKRNVADDPSRNFERPHRGVGHTGADAEICRGHLTEPSRVSKQLRFGEVLKDAVPHCSAKLFLEIFAGSGKLTSTVERLGGSALEPIEISNGPAFDLRRRQTQQTVLKWIKSGAISFVHLGTPATIWSRARHGVKSTHRNLAKEANGIELALFSCEVITTCARAGIHWAIENPGSSKLFHFEPLIRATRSGSCYEVCFDMCSYGEPFKKETKILTSAKCLQALERHCNHRRHSVWLKGRDQGQGVEHHNRTSFAGIYPQQFCNQYAHLLISHHLCACHGETDHAIQAHWSSAVRSFTTKAGKTKPRQRTELPAGGDQAGEPLCLLLKDQGGGCKYFDFIGLGREPKEAWRFLRKTRPLPRCGIG